MVSVSCRALLLVWWRSCQRLPNVSSQDHVSLFANRAGVHCTVVHRQPVAIHFQGARPAAPSAPLSPDTPDSISTTCTVHYSLRSIDRTQQKAQYSHREETPQPTQQKVQSAQREETPQPFSLVSGTPRVISATLLATTTQNICLMSVRCCSRIQAWMYDV